MKQTKVYRIRSTFIFARGSTMNQPHPQPIGKCRTASELWRLGRKECNRILEAAAILAERVYRQNANLAAFDAFGQRDLIVDSSNTELI
jgi:hypothetical protein